MILVNKQKLNIVNVIIKFLRFFKMKFNNLEKYHFLISIFILTVFLLFLLLLKYGSSQFIFYILSILYNLYLFHLFVVIILISLVYNIIYTYKKN